MQSLVDLLRAFSRGELRKVKSKEMEDEVKAICSLAADCELSVVWLWKERDHPIIKQADFLSRHAQPAMRHAQLGPGRGENRVGQGSVLWRMGPPHHQAGRLPVQARPAKPGCMFALGQVGLNTECSSSASAGHQR